MIIASFQRVYTKGAGPPNTRRLIRRCLLGMMLLCLVSTAACRTGSALTILPGSHAPDFTLGAARGDSYHLQDFLHQAVLLAFVNTQAEALAASEPSRSQIVSLKSMLEQYRSKGLRVVMVDAAHLRTGRQPTPDDLINFTYNWQLDTIPVLSDPRGVIAQSYGVSATPTTFLIASDGIVQQRWNGLATAPQLALAVESVIGASPSRLTSSVIPARAAACPDETPAQARFAGVGLARPLSNQIWVVDGGHAWGSGGAYSLQWIIVDDQPPIGDQSLTLRVIGYYRDSAQRFELVNQALPPLPTAEVRGLLIGETGPLPAVYLLPVNITLAGSGCLQIEAHVLRGGSSSAIYSGRSTVTVQ